VAAPALETTSAQYFLTKGCKSVIMRRFLMMIMKRRRRRRRRGRGGR
jgi:hypothetical protein